MIAAVTALRRVAERQQKALVATRQILKPQIAIGRKIQGLTGEIADRNVRIALRGRLDQAITAKDVGHPRHRYGLHLGDRRLFRG